MLEISNSLLLIIDLQEKLVKMLSDENCAPMNCEKILMASNILNIPTIITEQYPKGLGETIFSIKEANEDARYLEKTDFSAYKTIEIKEYLDKNERKQIILAGIELHICVLQTALDLKSFGYDVYIVKDACASRNENNFNTAIEYLKMNGIQIIDTEIALFELLRTSKHPNFKEIQALIK